MLTAGQRLKVELDDCRVFARQYHFRAIRLRREGLTRAAALAQAASEAALARAGALELELSERVQ